MEVVKAEAKLFTVIVLLYNNVQYIKECLDSILIQKYPNIEIVVVDDGSKCFDQESIQKYIEEHKKSNVSRILVYQNDYNFGTVKSANGAIRKSTGQYIKLIAADDALYDRNSLTIAAKALDDSPCGIVTGDVMNCDNDLHPMRHVIKMLLL